jgi:hypothetical protein
MVSLGSLGGGVLGAIAVVHTQLETNIYGSFRPLSGSQGESDAKTVARRQLIRLIGKLTRNRLGERLSDIGFRKNGTSLTVQRSLFRETCR